MVDPRYDDGSILRMVAFLHSSLGMAKVTTAEFGSQMCYYPATTDGIYPSGQLEAKKGTTIGLLRASWVPPRSRAEALHTGTGDSQHEQIGLLGIRASGF